MNDAGARGNPEIVRFLALCDSVKGDVPLTLPAVQSEPFMPFWPTLIMHKWDAEKQDFLYTYWGTELVKVYEMELTGKYILRGEFKETEQIFHRAHADAMAGPDPVYLHASIYWINKEYRSLDAVIVPMSHADGGQGTLAYLVFKR
ncbi:MAG: hypothetical protein JJ900_16655 [Rhodospirillales bacterium]|nr:hypothetical protein [Rhodospirillales bacterium]MBO6788481.1 hypothetical protein [Rhodospirillales bacterium]